MGPESKYLTVVVGVVNCFIYLELAVGYFITARVYENPEISRTTISLGILVFVQLLVNFMLTVGAVKKIPTLLLPWLGVQSVNLGLSLFCLALIMFFGKIHLKLSVAEYTGTLMGLSIYTAVTLICCIVVVQFRKDVLRINISQRRDDLEGPSLVDVKLPPPAYSIIEEEKDWRETFEDPPPQYEEAVAMSVKTAFTL